MSIIFFSTVKGWRALTSERQPPKTRNKTPLFPRNLKNPAKAGFFLAICAAAAAVALARPDVHLRLPAAPNTTDILETTRVCVRQGTRQLRESSTSVPVRTLRCNDAAPRRPLTVDYHLSLETDALGRVHGPASELG